MYTDLNHQHRYPMSGDAFSDKRTSESQEIKNNGQKVTSKTRQNRDEYVKADYAFQPDCVCWIY